MEEALWALNKMDWSGWTVSGSTATKTITGFTFDGDVTGQINLVVTGARTATSTGTTTQSGTGITVTRTLTSNWNSAPLLVNAVAATSGTIRFAGSGTVNSYDSRTGAYSDATAGYSAILSSGSTSTSGNAVQLTNAQVMGYVATVDTGPSYGTSARVYGPTTPLTTKIDPNRLSTSPYQPLFTELVPTGAGWSALSGHNETIGTNGATTSSYYYSMGLAIDNETITVAGPVVLVVVGNLDITSTARFRITTGGSLQLHVTGNIAIGGAGMQNETTLPKNMVLISTAAATATMATSVSYHGVIYAPNTALTVSGTQIIYGAMVVQSATFSATPTIHYDVALRDNVLRGVTTPYAISDLRETTGGN
jgi:hypothetical protein